MAGGSRARSRCPRGITRSARRGRSSARAPTGCRRPSGDGSPSRGGTRSSGSTCGRVRCSTRGDGEGEPLAPNPAWLWEFVRAGYPLRPLTLEPHPGRAEGPMTLAWVVPPWRVGSGGHTTVLRLIRALEERGHRSAIFVFDPGGWDDRSADELREEIRTKFVPVDAPVFRGFDDWIGADVADRDELVDRMAAARLARVPREGLPRAGRRAAVRARLGAAHLGGGDVPHGLSRHRVHAVDGRGPRGSVRHAGAVVRVRHRSRYVHVRRRAARAGPRRGLRPARDAAARGRDRARGRRNAVRAPARRARRAVRIDGSPRLAGPGDQPRRASRRASSLRCTGARARAWCSP